MQKFTELLVGLVIVHLQCKLEGQQLENILFDTFGVESVVFE